MRQGKEEHDLEALKSDWKVRETLGFDAKAFMQNREQTPSSNLFSTIKDRLCTLFSSHNKEPSELEAASACVQVAIETLSQRTAVFTERALKGESLKHSLVMTNRLIKKPLMKQLSMKKKHKICMKHVA